MEALEDLRLARQAIQSGDRDAARKHLFHAIRVDPRNEQAWLWLSAVIDDPDKERDCLQRVLRINPANEVAQRHLARLDDEQVPAEATGRPTPATRAPPVTKQATIATKTAPPATKTRQRFAGKRLPFLVAVAVLALLYVLRSYCGSDGTSSTPAKTRAPSTPAKTRTPTPSLGDLDISSPFCHWIDSLGSYRCEGTIRNRGSGTWRSVRIRVVVEEQGGRQVGSDWSYMDSDRLVPGAISTWTVYVDAPPPRAESRRSDTAQVLDGRRE